MSNPQYPTVDESCSRLRRAGWSFGWTGSATLWQVSGHNGENRIQATGSTLAEALWVACQQAREVMMGGQFGSSRGVHGGGS